MIVGLTIVILAAVSVHVRRVVNETAIFIVCAFAWVLMWIAVPLESSRRVWRLAGVAALAVFFLTAWKGGELVIRLLRQLP
jgi:hypothetical protein